jgi:hypothetical protein
MRGGIFSWSIGHEGCDVSTLVIVSDMEVNPFTVEGRFESCCQLAHPVKLKPPTHLHLRLLLSEQAVNLFRLMHFRTPSSGIVMWFRYGCALLLRHSLPSRLVLRMYPETPASMKSTTETNSKQQPLSRHSHGFSAFF